MSEKFRGYHISEESEEYEKYKTSVKKFKADVPTTAYGMRELDSIEYWRKQKTFFTCDAADINERHYLSPVDYDKKMRDLDQYILDIQESERRYFKYCLTENGGARSLALFFEEGLGIEGYKPILESYSVLDDIYPIPDQYKLMIAFNEGQITPTIEKSIHFYIIEESNKKYEQEINKLVKTPGLNIDSLLAELTDIKTQIDETKRAEIDKFKSALHQLTEKAANTKPSPIPNELLEENFKIHLETYQSKESKLQEYEPRLKQAYLTSVEKAIQEGWLPVDINVVKKRLAETKIVLKDYLNLRSPDEHGDHSIHDLEISVASNLDPKRYDEILFHESTHLISGRTMTQKDNSSWDMTNVLHQKIGLRFDVQKTKPKIEEEEEEEENRRFVWLNEAVTEEITMRLRNQLVSEYYQGERLILLDLYRDGLDPKLVYEAYFENYAPIDNNNNNNNNPVPKWKEFSKAIKQILDWDALIRFDHKYNKPKKPKENKN